MSTSLHLPIAPRGRVLSRWLLTAALTALGLAGLGPDHGGAWAQSAPSAQRTEQERYEQGVREAEAARRAYEAELALYRQRQDRHQQDVARSADARAAYESRLASREAVPASRASAPAAAPSCEQQQARSRSRGRLIGGLLGGVAGAVAGRRGETAALVSALVPAGALLGDAIAGLLDCREQQQAAAATEQAASRGVGTTTSWTSATRPSVSGSSTVTAAAPAADGGDCLSVTDVVIVDGEETRAPKRLCRRPPANRYVRV